MIRIPIFEMLICSVDIRDQSRKLQEIATNLGRFFRRHKFFGAGIVKIVKVKVKVKTSIYIARFMHQAPLTRTSLKLGRQTAI